MCFANELSCKIKQKKKHKSLLVPIHSQLKYMTVHIKSIHKLILKNTTSTTNNIIIK